MRWIVFLWALCALCACAQVDPGLDVENLEGASDAATPKTAVACADGPGCKPVAGDCNAGQPANTDAWCDQQLLLCKNSGKAEIDCKSVYEKCTPEAPLPAPPLPVPAAGNSCADQVKLCHEKGADPKPCDEFAKQCADDSPVAVDPWCREQLSICDKGGKAEIDCKSVYGKCRPPNATSPGMANAGCVDQVKLCYARGMADTVCIELQLNCAAVLPPSPSPGSSPSPNGSCAEQLASCIKNGNAELDCKSVYEKCSSQPAPAPALVPATAPAPAPPLVPDCADQVKLCYAKGEDVAVCVELEKQCKYPPPPSVDPWCAEQLAKCKADVDPNACGLYRDKCSL